MLLAGRGRDPEKNGGERGQNLRLSREARPYTPRSLSVVATAPVAMDPSPAEAGVLLSVAESQDRQLRCAPPAAQMPPKVVLPAD